MSRGLSYLASSVVTETRFHVMEAFWSTFWINRTMPFPRAYNMSSLKERGRVPTKDSLLSSVTLRVKWSNSWPSWCQT